MRSRRGCGFTVLVLVKARRSEDFSTPRFRKETRFLGWVYGCCERRRSSGNAEERNPWTLPDICKLAGGTVHGPWAFCKFGMTGWQSRGK